ncbi:hypothetical protein [Roseivirga sp.]|uniref:hypothetical protein n=1 Tax=Roseivirga sp. TaxID=1964215 RepID=UPI003B527B2A
MKVDLTEITEEVFRMQTNTICMKFREACTIYSEKQPDSQQTIKILKHTDALLYKFTLATINLEFLWKISEFKKEALIKDDQQVGYEWNNSKSIIDSIFFESTIIQIRAFIDFAQKLSCVRIGYYKPINGTNHFYKILKSSESYLASQIEKVFKEVDESWGQVIRSLRDKVLHYDLIKTSHSFRPSIQEKNYEEFAQGLTNEMFEFLMTLSEVIFGIEWISGTFDQFKVHYSR